MCMASEDEISFFLDATVSILRGYNMPYASWNVSPGPHPSCTPKTESFQISVDILNFVSDSFEFRVRSGSY